MTNGHKKDYVSEYQTTPKIGGRKKQIENTNQ